MLVTKLNAIRAEKDAEDRGFTLIELLVVVVIIGILIAIAIPLYLNYQHGAKDKSADSDLRGAVTALQQCYGDNNNTYPATATQSAAGANLVFANCTSQATSSGGTTLTYAYDTTGKVVTMTATNADGSGKTYTYKSDTAKITNN